METPQQKNPFNEEYYWTRKVERAQKALDEARLRKKGLHIQPEPDVAQFRQNLKALGLEKPVSSYVSASELTKEVTQALNGETRTTSSTGGEKGTKEARYDLIPVDALESVAVLYGRGANKYAPHNWRKGYEWSKSYSALQRHAQAFWNGEDYDPELGTPHMASVIFHALALMTFTNEQPDFDDRFIAGDK